MTAHLLAIAALCFLAGFAFAVWLTYPPYPMRHPLWRKGMAPYADAPNADMPIAGYNENRGRRITSETWGDEDDYQGADRG